METLYRDILALIPDTEEYATGKLFLREKLTSIPYAAPEMINNYVWTMWHFLQETFPINNDDVNPPWLVSIRNTWNDFNLEIQKIKADASASTDEEQSGDE